MISCNDLLRTVFDNALDGISVADLDGRYVSVNPSFCKMLGYSRDALLRMRVADLLPADQSGKLFAEVARGGRATHSARLRHRDGHLVAVEISSSRGEVDGAAYVLAIVRDISEREQVAATVDESRGRLQALLDASEQAIFSKDRNGVITDVNAAYRRLFGQPAEALIGMTSADIFSGEEEIRRVLANDRRVFELGETVHSEDHLRIAGRDYVFHVTKVPVRAPDGTITGLCGFARDITERQRTDAEIQRLNRTLRMVSDCNQTLVRVDSEATLLETICAQIVSSGGYRMAWVGYADSDESRTLRPIAHAGAEQGYLDAIRITWAEEPSGLGPAGRAMRSGKSVVSPDIANDPSFAPFRDAALARGYASMISIPLLTAKRAIGLLCIYADQTNAFHAQEVELLGELAGDLAFGIQTLRERSEHELLRNQLFQAQKMEAVGTLVGGLAHDFNNILGGMLGNLYLLRAKVSDRADAAQRIARVEALGQRAVDLVARLMTFAHKDDVRMKPLSLRALLGESFTLHRVSIPENIELRVDLGDEALTVDADAGLIEQMLLNLISNAKDAVEQCAAARISVSLRSAPMPASLLARHPSLRGKRCAKLSVEDNGHGISEENLGRIFDPFFTTKGPDKGTGLGLAMAYGAAESHGGGIEVRSTKGKGSVFDLYLPLVDKAADSQASTIDRVTSGDGQLILVADDDVAVCQMLRDVVEALGYRVLVAVDGESALEVFDAHSDEIDLALLDMVMPKLDGAAAARRLRERRSELPVIFHSGYGVDATAVADLPRTLILPKPATVEAISAALATLLRDGNDR